MSISDRLAAITARAEEATEGPWETGWDGQQFYVAPVSARGDEYERIMEMTFVINPGSSQDQGECATEDAEFISHSRSDVPWLVEQVRKRDTALGAVLDVCDRLEEAHRVNPKETYEHGLREAAHEVRHAIAVALGEVEAREFKNKNMTLNTGMAPPVVRYVPTPCPNCGWMRKNET